MPELTPHQLALNKVRAVNARIASHKDRIEKLKILIKQEEAVRSKIMKAGGLCQ